MISEVWEVAYLFGLVKGLYLSHCIDDRHSYSLFWPIILNSWPTILHSFVQLGNFSRMCINALLAGHWPVCSKHRSWNHPEFLNCLPLGQFIVGSFKLPSHGQTGFYLLATPLSRRCMKPSSSWPWISKFETFVSSSSRSTTDWSSMTRYNLWRMYQRVSDQCHFVQQHLSELCLVLQPL